MKNHVLDFLICSPQTNQRSDSAYDMTFECLFMSVSFFPATNYVFFLFRNTPISRNVATCSLSCTRTKKIWMIRICSGPSVYLLT